MQIETHKKVVEYVLTLSPDELETIQTALSYVYLEENEKFDGLSNLGRKCGKLDSDLQEFLDLNKEVF